MAALPDPDRRAQRIRLRRTLYAGGVALALTAVVLMLGASGAYRLGGLHLALLLAGFWAVNLVILALILSGLNLRLPDPSMTLMQMLWATVSTFVFFYFADEGRHLILMLYLLAMMFGAFRLDVGEYLVVTLTALVLYGGALTLLKALHPDLIDVHDEAVNWLVFLIVMVAFSVLGAEASQLRSALERRGHQLREAHDAAAVADAAKSSFLASTSHELRTPLNMIIGAQEVIGDQGLDDEQRDALTRARHAGAHLLSLVNSMIDLARLESGDVALRPAAFDLRAHLDEVHAMFAPLAEDRGIALVLDAGEGIEGTVEGDMGRLDEVLVHLLNNAVKFTASGEVRLSAGREPGAGDHVRFTVTDSGGGMEATELATLFQPFTSGDGSRPVTGRSGLGLALCRQLVALMGGTLEAESRPGEGSRFSFAVPMPEVDVQPERRASGLGDAQVLVVDDSPDNLLLMRTFLQGSVGHVDTAVNGREGVEKFAKAHYDVVLMDMHMPGMNGIEATRAIRELESGHAGRAPAAILALTADDSVNDRERSLDAGCDDHLVKPISKKALLAAVASHAEARSRAG